MGQEVSTERLRRLTDEGFTVAESRLALEATNGNVDAALEILRARRHAAEQAQGGALAYRINQFLRTQRPWDEFFDRFLWPEHLHERVSTNLHFYRGNYAIISIGIVGVSLLLQPALLVCTGLAIAAHVAAAEWATPIPGPDGTPLTVSQRLAIATLTSSLMFSWSGHSARLMRIAFLCCGTTLLHAAFRARTLTARWSFFRETVEKQD
jgi:hypothetical protein